MNKVLLSAMAGLSLLGATTAQAATPTAAQRAPQRSVVASPEAATAHSSDLFGLAGLTALLAAGAVIVIVAVVIVVADNNSASS